MLRFVHMRRSVNCLDIGPKGGKFDSYYDLQNVASLSVCLDHIFANVVSDRHCGLNNIHQFYFAVHVKCLYS